MEVIKKIGIPALLEQLAEECAELSQASLKLARKLRGDNPTPMLERDIMKNLCEETADVMLCVDILNDAGLMISKEIEDIIISKHARWINRLRDKPVKTFTVAEIAYAYSHFGIDLTQTEGDVITDKEIDGVVVAVDIDDILKGMRDIFEE